MKISLTIILLSITLVAFAQKPPKQFTKIKGCKGGFIYNSGSVEHTINSEKTIKILSEGSVELEKATEQLGKGEASFDLNALFSKDYLNKIKYMNDLSPEFYSSWNVNIKAICDLKEVIGSKDLSQANKDAAQKLLIEIIGDFRTIKDEVKKKSQ